MVVAGTSDVHTVVCVEADLDELVHVLLEVAVLAPDDNVSPRPVDLVEPGHHELESFEVHVNISDFTSHVVAGRQVPLQLGPVDPLHPPEPGVRLQEVNPCSTDVRSEVEALAPLDLVDDNGRWVFLAAGSVCQPHLSIAGLNLVNACLVEHLQAQVLHDAGQALTLCFLESPLTFPGSSQFFLGKEHGVKAHG